MSTPVHAITLAPPRSQLFHYFIAVKVYGYRENNGVNNWVCNGISNETISCAHLLRVKAAQITRFTRFSLLRVPPDAPLLNRDGAIIMPTYYGYINMNRIVNSILATGCPPKPLPLPPSRSILYQVYLDSRNEWAEGEGN